MLVKCPEEENRFEERKSKNKGDNKEYVKKKGEKREKKID